MASSCASPAFDTARRQVFIVGNEAADVDSLVSAYAMATLLESSDVQAIPLAQIPREEFRLRGDALKLFSESGAEVLPDGSPAKLLFWDEVDWQQADDLMHRKLVLTDHNRMTAQVAQHFEGRVEWVLDHHAGGDSYPEARKDIDEGLGSACTLVVEQFLKGREERLSQEMQTLLAGVILMDCRNFSPTENKGTPRDRQALSALEKGLPARGADVWYEELMLARKEISHLSARELMLMDMKVITLRGLSVLMPSLQSSLTESCEKAGGHAELEAVAKALTKDRGHQASVLLFTKDKVTGKKAMLLVAADDQPDAAQLCADLVKLMQVAPGELPKHLLENPLYQSQGLVETGFQLERVKELEAVQAYNLKGSVSRKTVIPLFMTISAL